MKKIFLLLSIFVLSKVGYSQFPVIQYIGSDSTIVKSRGGLQGRFAPIPFTDTSAANLSRISQYPGALIYTSGVDKYWYRNSGATGWIEFTSSGGSTVNIYNSNGNISEDRYVDGGEHRLQFNALQSFQVAADSITFNLVENYLFLTGLVSTQDTSTYKPMVVDPITGRVLQSSYWYGSGDSSIFATVYRTDTLAQNIRDEIAAIPAPTLQQVFATESNNALMTGDFKVNVNGFDIDFNNAVNGFITVDKYLSIGGEDSLNMQSSAGNRILLKNDTIFIKPKLGNLNIDSLNSGSSSDSVLVWDQSTGMVKKRNAADFGGGGSGTVTSVGTGYGLSGGTITTTGTILVDSASLSNYYLRRKDSLTSSNLLGYVTRTVLADTAAALRVAISSGTPDTSVFLVDTLYNRLATVINVDSMRLKSVEIKLNGSAVTPTTTDSTLSWDILASGSTTGVKSIEIVGDSAYLVNDSSTFVNANKVYGYADGLKGWKDTKKMTFTIPYTGEVVMISGDSLINGRKVDTAFISASGDSLVTYIANTRYAYKITVSGGATPAGNYGNVQLNRNSALATPASDSLNFTAGSGLNVKGKYLIKDTQMVRLPGILQSSIYGNGGSSMTGSYNTLLGIGAGNSITSGTQNTALGSRSMGGTTVTGLRNTAAGEGAVYSLSSGNDNTGIGSLALSNTTTTVSSTAVGSTTLQNANGNYNNGFGYAAGLAITSGVENAAMSAFSIYTNQTGSYNTAVGVGALLGGGGSHSNNTAIGRRAGYGVTTGGNNIFLGYHAGEAHTSGSKNIIIGYDIDAPSNTASNQMTIGNAIFGTGITGTGTTAAGKVGILNNAPDSTLDVTGGFKVSGGVRFSGIPDGGTTSDSLLVATSTGQVKKMNNYFASGVHTPTATNGTNVSASTPGQTQYMRVGNTVTVSGYIDISCTSASITSQIDLTLPIASAFSNTVQLSGIMLEAVTGVASPGNGTVVSQATDDRLSIDFTPRATGSLSYRFTYTYQIL